MITATGRTFEHRDTIRSLGGWWSGAHKAWVFKHLIPAQLAQLRRCVGVIVNDKPVERPAWAKPTPVQREPEKKLFIGNDETYRHSFMHDDPLIYWGFDSLSSFVDFVETIERPPAPRDKGWSVPAEFTATASLAEAIQIARTGWLGALGMASLLDSPTPTAKRRIRTVSGGTVNVARMLSGNPAHMTRRARLPAKRSITLFVETVSWRNTPHDVLLIRGIAVAAIVDHLEAAGYRCTIVATYSSLRDDFQPMQLAVKIKDSHERLSIADISFALGHPSFGRRLVYAAKSLDKCHTIDSADDVRGMVGTAFDDDHPPGRDEYYIPHLGRYTGTDLFEILDRIEPADLPIKVKRN